MKFATHGYTESILALCYRLGYSFMPRLRDLKDQPLYRIDRPSNAGVFTPLLTKTADLDMVEEQGDATRQTRFKCWETQGVASGRECSIQPVCV